MIVGEDQSGKTSLLKKYILTLRNSGFYPIYIKDPAELLQGDFSYRMGRLFKDQYDTELDADDLKELANQFKAEYKAKIKQLFYQ